MEINEKIRNYMDENGIKQTFLEKETGLSHDKISKILCGKRKLSAYELSLFAKALKVSADIFLN